ncbi:Do family serine endopeptidase [Lichenicoccus sp.]|uniref:Do family serine endopeptidase n=1 Tax=Lichenicoccus sp. TaxID=2781899 RepID=UPI003D14D87E
MLTGVAGGRFETGTAHAQSPSSSALAAHPGAIQPQAPSQRLPDFTALVKQVKPAVVSITSQLKADTVEDDDQDQGGGGGGGQQMPFPFPFGFQMQHGNPHRTIEARGSGFIISPDGFVVTNNHVVKGATSVSVTLDDGTVLPAQVVGRDARTDLALLRVKPGGKLPFIQLGDSDDVEPGQWVIAVGNPYGLGGSVTAGIVSARGRDIGDGPYDSFLQIDAPINRGNSGGPLFTQDGKVVGVNTAILSPSGGSIGIGFAIPSDVVRNVIAQLQKHGRVTRGYLGVQAQAVTPQIAKGLDLPASLGSPPGGALVANVTNGSPAEKSGIKPGDVITQINGEKVGTPRDLAIKVASVAPDSQARLTYLRDGSSQTVDVHVGNLGKDGNGAGGSDNGQPGSQGSIGVGLASLTPDLRQQLGIDDSVHGAVVHSVQPNSAADQAGIRPGDIILGVGSHLVSNPADAAKAVHSALQQDQTVALRILRDGQDAFVAISPNANGAGGSQAPDGDEDGGNGGGQDNNQSG